MSPDMPCPSERKDRASFKEVPEIFSDVSRDQPIVKNLDCPALQRLWTTYEPITIRAFDRHVEQPYKSAILCLMILAGMHQRDPKSLSRRFEQIGRASGGERVCQYVEISVVGGSLKKKTEKREWIPTEY